MTKMRVSVRMLKKKNEKTEEVSSRKHNTSLHSCPLSAETNVADDCPAGVDGSITLHTRINSTHSEEMGQCYTR